MENAYHAIIMAGAIIVFVVATSIGIYTYNRILYSNNQILTESEYFDRTAENFSDSQFAEDTDRVYSGAEVALQVLNMYERKDFSYKSITVNGVTYLAPNAPAGDVGLNVIANKEMNNISSSLQGLSSNEYVVTSQSYEDGKGVSISYSKK